MVYMFLVNGFEETEAIVPLDILRRADVDVATVGIGGCDVTGSHGITVKADISEENATGEGLEMIVLPGGPGAVNLEKSPVVQRLIDMAVEHSLPIGAICFSPSILGHRGILKGKKAVVFPGNEKDLYGAAVMSEAVCVDGNIITAVGAGVSIQFGLALVEKLKGKSTADEVAARMQVRQE